MSQEAVITTQPEVKSFWLEAITTALPVIMGYLPVGAAYGVLAQEAGLSPLNTILMSLLVYAGSGQLIAVSLFGGGAPALSIIITTFIVNFRHFLMSASISTFLKKWRNRELFSFSMQLTDETFALHTNRFSEDKLDKKTTFLINILCQSGWVAGSIIGVVASNLLGDTEKWGIDYALTGMFIALLAMQIKDKRQLLISLVSGGSSVALFLTGMDQWNVITATIIAATFGTGVRKWIKK